MIDISLTPAPCGPTLPKQGTGHHATETPLPLTDPKGSIVYPGFPADVLFSFRLYSICDQVILWGTLALAFGPMAERVLRGGDAAL